MSKMDDTFINQANQQSSNESEDPQMEEISFGEEKVMCKKIEFNNEFPPTFFDDADRFRKVGLVNARQATATEEIISSQDGNKINTAESGDWIIHNPGDVDPYVFGDKHEKNEDGSPNKDKPISVEQRQKAFEKKYETKPGEEGVFIPKGIIKAKRVDENFAWTTSWGENDSVKAGGWVSEGGYAIAEDSFSNTYEKIENDQE